MENENDYLDKLYSAKFEKFEVQSSDADWNKLNSKLGKSNFLKFSFASFNVFYLAAFLSFAGTASYFGASNLIKSNKINSLEKKIEVLEEKLKKNETSPIITDSVFIENQEDKNETKIISDVKKDVLQKNNEAIPTLSSKKDSVYTKPDSASVIKPEAQKIKRIKKTVYIKKDKVLVTDTVVKKKEK